ncbi:MAG: bifunctional alpha/beta hydrolase/class I SAM-dependent methyltransferase [Pirellulales bacterium]
MTSWDGTELFYRCWAPATSSKKALLLFHRGHEHSGRFQDFIDRLAMDDCWAFAWDARGHGHTEGERGYAPSLTTLVRDLECFVEHIADKHRITVDNMAVVANSIGAIVVSAWIHDHAPPLRATVLATPALRVKLYVPLAIPALRLLSLVRRKAFITSYVRPRMLTHDEEMIREYAEDPLITRNIAVNMLLDLHDTATRLMDHASAVHTPTLILSAGRDWVVHQKPQRRFHDALSSRTKQISVYDDSFHAILHEAERDQTIDEIRDFLTKQFHDPTTLPSLLDADERGASRNAFARLCQPLPYWSPRGMLYRGTRLFLHTLGRLSRGIDVGCRTGFNSGASLDHVYREQARGWGPLGRLIDRIYLNGPGWRGVRERKQLLQELLTRAIRELARSHRRVQLLDIASGPGRYVLDTLAQLHVDQFADVDVRATLCDRSTEALEQGRATAEQLGVTGVTFSAGDALCEQSLAATTPRPNLAVVSGLYELIPENAPVLASLRGLGKAVDPDGFLVYTNQPWHPQLELIAHSLDGFDAKPWRMRCRSQLEMDQLVATAGFKKITTLSTDQGIFTVSLARRTCAP